MLRVSTQEFDFVIFVDGIALVFKGQVFFAWIRHMRDDDFGKEVLVFIEFYGLLDINDGIGLHRRPIWRLGIRRWQR